MIDLLLILTINSLYIFGLWYAAGKEMIFEPLVKPFEDFPWWFKKPIYDCPICMASVHSYIFPLIILFFGLDITLLWVWPFYIVMLAGLNGIILNIGKPKDVEVKQGLVGKEILAEINEGYFWVEVLDNTFDGYLCLHQGETVIVSAKNIKKVG